MLYFLQYVAAPSSSSGNWTEPTGGIFARYQVRCLLSSIRHSMKGEADMTSSPTLPFLPTCNDPALLYTSYLDAVAGGWRLASHRLLCRGSARSGTDTRPNGCPQRSHLGRKKVSVDTIKPTTFILFSSVSVRSRRLLKFSTFRTASSALQDLWQQG